MNGVELFLLGRTLMKIGEEAMPTEGLPEYSTSVRAVLIVASDIVQNPGSAVGEIALRTGLPQSQVSGCIARLREAEAIVSEPDPTDRRRTLVRQAPEASDRVDLVRSTTVDSAIAAALGTEDSDEVSAVVTALETLARRLTPTTLSRVRPASGRSRSSVRD